MTDLQTDPDTGETPRIPGETTVRIRPVGETQTRLYLTPGEATQNIAGWDAGLPPRLRRPDAHTLDITEVLPLWPTGAELAVEQKLADTGTRLYNPEALRPAAPNPGPLPPTPVEPNPPAPRPSAPGPAETAVVSLLAALAPDGERPKGYEGRHRDPHGRTAAPGERRWGSLVEAVKPQTEPRRWWVGLVVGACLVVWATTVVISLQAMS